MTLHYTHDYLMNPPHKVTVDLVGIGGTGSQVLTNLARMNEALVGLGHPGLHVICWDDDRVSDANIGRQLFSPADIGQFKSVVLTTRINRYFGYEWQAQPVAYTATRTSNITITCVDTAMARLMISSRIEGSTKQKRDPTERLYYWLDMGNLLKMGQAVLGTIHPIKQPHKTGTAASLKTVTKKFNLNKIKEEKQGPSCSLADALTKQDLFINSTLAQLGCNILWKLFREGFISHHGCYVNLETMSVNPIKI